MMLFKGKIPLLQLPQKVHHVSPHVQDIEWFSSWWLWSSHLIFKFQILSSSLFGFLAMTHLLISLGYGKAKVVMLVDSPCSPLGSTIARRMDGTQHIVILMAMIYYSEVIQRTISKGKSRRTKSRGSQVQVCKGSFPVESHRECLSLLATSCDNMCEVLSTREAH